MELAEQSDSVPVVTDLLLDMETPVSAFRKLRRPGPAFLLESLEGGETWGRYSMLAVGARAVMRVAGDRVTVEEDGGRRSFVRSEPLAALRELLERNRPAELAGVPRFAGGAVGYLGYDLVRRFERLPNLAPDDLGLPTAQLMIADTVIVFDNLAHTVQVVHHAAVGEDLEAAYRAATAALDRTVERLAAPPVRVRGAASPPCAAAPDATPLAAAAPGDGGPLRGFRSATGKDRFCRAVESIRGEIAAGEAIQVVLSHRLARAYAADPFDAYRALRVINPSPYMFYLDFGDLQVAGASPEVLVRVEGERVVVRPIAGTRPRGAAPAADRRLEEELRADAKERAEHLMLVDLGRNDVGRVARFGSVRVDDFMTVERYSHVMHLVSEVSGRLRPGLTCFDALRAAFPAGTVSGAPKVRAMQLIEALEPHRRGVYAGAVGYFDYHGSMDTCIAIRSLVFKEQTAYLQVGAGVVADSVPEREWQETLHKAGALLRAVEMAGDGLRLRRGPARTAAPRAAALRRPLGE